MVPRLRKLVVPNQGKTVLFGHDFVSRLNVSSGRNWSKFISWTNCVYLIHLISIWGYSTETSLNLPCKTKPFDLYSGNNTKWNQHRGLFEDICGRKRKIRTLTEQIQYFVQWAGTYPRLQRVDSMVHIASEWEKLKIIMSEGHKSTS